MKKVEAFLSNYFIDKKIRHSIFILVCVCLTLSVLFFSIFVVSYLVYSLNQSENEALQFASAQVVSSLDSLLKRYELLAVNLAYNNNLIHLLKTEAFSMAKMLEMKDSINDVVSNYLISFSHNAGDIVGLMPVFQEITMYSNNKIFNQYESVIEYFDNYEETPWYESLSTNPHTEYFQFDETAVYLSRAIINVNDGSVQGAVKLKIPLYKIQRVVENVFDDQKYEAVIADESNTIIMSTLSKNITGTLFDFDKMNKYYFMEKTQDKSLGIYMCTVKDKATAQAQILIAVFLSLLLCVVVALIVLFLAMRVVKAIAKNFEDFAKRVQQVNIVTEERHDGFRENDSELGLLGKELNQMINRLSEYVLTEQETTKVIHEMQLELLQTQINPHLLYNTLSTISYKSNQIGATELEALAQNLSEFYRGILNHGKLERSFRDEFATLISYCDVMKRVYELDLDLVIDIDDSLLENTIIKLLFQPIVENSIKHGFLPNKEGCIYIGVDKNDEFISISISDTGRGMSPEKLEEIKESLYCLDSGIGYGTSNVVKRLKNYYGSSSSFEITSELDMGTEVVIRVPVHKNTK